jgi:hypothetical protein
MEDQYNNIRESLININNEINEIEKKIKKCKNNIKFISNDDDFKEFVKNYNDMIKEDELLLNEKLKVKENLKKLLDETGLYDENYRINNIIDMKRDVNVKLSYYLSDDQKRQLFNVSQNYWSFKDNLIFKMLNHEPKLFLTEYCKRITPHTFAVDVKFNNDVSSFQGLFLCDPMPVNSGSYILILKIIQPNTEMRIKFNGDDDRKFRYHTQKEEVKIDERETSDYFYVSPLLRKWNINDYLHFIINTNEKKITYFVKYNNIKVDSDIVDLYYKIKKPLHVFININNYNKIYLCGFNKFNN